MISARTSPNLASVSSAFSSSSRTPRQFQRDMPLTLSTKSRDRVKAAIFLLATLASAPLPLPSPGRRLLTPLPPPPRPPAGRSPLPGRDDAVAVAVTACSPLIFPSVLFLPASPVVVVVVAAAAAC